VKVPFSSSIRLALAISAVFVLLALLAGAATYTLQTRAMSSQLADDVKGLATGLAQIAAQGDRQDLIEQTMALSGSVGDGSLIAVFADAKSGEAFGNATISAPVPGARELAAGHDVSLKQPIGDPPDSYFAYGVSTPLGNVLVGKDDGPLIENQRILLTTMGWGLGIALILSILLAVAIARFNEGRIARIGRALDGVAGGNFGARIGPMGHDDLGHLAAEVDHTLDRLGSGIEAIRQVSTDVAHDLRAPLGRLRIRLEPLALSADLQEQARMEIGSALAEIDAISATFAAILRLARLESGAVKLATEEVDLALLLREVCDLFQSTAEGRYTIALDPPDGPLIHACDKELITQAVVNLVHNSVRHCPAPVHIVMCVEADENEVAISVADDGPGILPADRERVLKRFVRLDTSRSASGTGLGLSLVAAIAELHGGRIELNDNRPGLKVTIALPSRKVEQS
jgi:signal transduction histidine kinase